MVAILRSAIALLLLASAAAAATFVSTNTVAPPEHREIAGPPGAYRLTVFLVPDDAFDLSSSPATLAIRDGVDNETVATVTGTVSTIATGKVSFAFRIDDAGRYNLAATIHPPTADAAEVATWSLQVTNAPAISLVIGATSNSITINAATNAFSVTNNLTVSNSFIVTGLTVTNNFTPSNTISVTVTTGVQAVNGGQGIVTITPGNIGAVSNLVTVGTITGAIADSTMYLTNFSEAATFVNGSNTYFEGRFSTQLFTNSTTTPLLFTNIVDEASNWNISTRTYTIATAGVYCAWCYLGINLLNAATPYILSITAGKSGTTNAVAQFRNNTVNASTDVSIPLTMASLRMAVGDTFQFLFFQQSGGTRTNSASRSGIYRLGD